VKGVYLLAIHPSALKRARQNEARRMRNRSVKTKVKKVIKTVRLAVEEGSDKTAADQLNLAKSIIDKAAKKGAIHKKAAARKISRLSKRLNSTLP
jgi:small subunit ribosomal protein S20